jgi:very-short-patch-repair endonuclease
VARGAPSSWYRDLWASLLWAGPGAAFGFKTAAVLHGLDGVSERAVEIVCRKKSRSPSRSIVVHCSTRDFSVDCVWIARLPVTSVARTLVDLGAVCSRWRVELALDDALRKKLVTPKQLVVLKGWHGGRGRPGSATLGRLLDERPSDVRPLGSPLERDFVRILRSGGLPHPVRQHSVQLRNEEIVYLDFAYPEYLVGVEADGYRWHAGRRSWQADLDRQNRLAEVGWLLLRFTSDDLRRPQWIVEKIARTLAQRTFCLSSGFP